MMKDPKILTLDEYKKLVQIKLNSSDFEILSLDEFGLDERAGFLGEHFHIKIEVERDAQHCTENGSNKTQQISPRETEIVSFFAKILPARGHFRKLVEDMRGFEKEIFFYTVLSKDLSPFLSHTKTFPKCYMAKKDRVILEDMREVGLKPIADVRQTVNFEHCKQTLSALARFHSASIAVEEKSKKSLKQLYPEIMFENIFVAEGIWGAWLEAGFKACDELLLHLPAYKNEPLLLTKIQEKFKGLKSALFKSVEPNATARNVICHGDSWVSNFLFQYKDQHPTNAALIDFQALRYCPPALDVQLFLYLSLEYDKDRPYKMSKLQDFYYECLTAELNRHNFDIHKILPKTEFKQTCESSALFASLAAIMYYQMMQVDPGYMDKVMEDQNLYERYVTQNRTEDICTFFETDMRFRKFMNNAMEALIKIILGKN